jgi:hypothetical protein
MDAIHWSETDYDNLSWHDNHVHGLKICEGEHGTGQLVLDLDYILEWMPDGNQFKFRIAPATLTFRRVSDLTISLNYVNPSAAITPFSISSITREPYTYTNGYSTFRWSIGINWPEGEITFIAEGFNQMLRSQAITVDEMYLTTTQRGGT